MYIKTRSHEIVRLAFRRLIASDANEFSALLQLHEG